MSVQAREVIVIPATIGNHIDSTIQKKLRVASYSRVSTDFDGQLISFNTQKAYYIDLIFKNPNWTSAGNFADEGISGAMAEIRPDFMRMIRHCKKRKEKLLTNTTKCMDSEKERTENQKLFLKKQKSSEECTNVIYWGIVWEKSSHS